MKRQLDRLKGKRLVTGDPNLMTKDEICINATPNGVEVKEIGTDGKIKDLAGSGNNGGGGNSSFKYESAKVIWEIDYTNADKELLANMLTVISVVPIYAVYSEHTDMGGVYSEKMYGITSSFMLGVTVGGLHNDKDEPDEYIVKYIEEAKGPFTITIEGQTVTFNNLRELFNMYGIPLEIAGFKEIPYEEFNPRINNELGNFLN